MLRFPRSKPAVALAAILLLALALRIVGARYGLPYPLLDPDEASIVPRSWRMTHGGHVDPGWYDYPSLLMAVLAPVQAFFGAPSYGAAHAVAIVIGLGGVAAAWWLGRRAYGTGAGLVGAAAVAVSTTHIAYSRVAVTDVLLTLAITAALALAVEGRLAWAGAAVGLAAAAKYPGVLAAVPIVVAGWGSWRALGRSAVIATCAFVVASPFVLIHAGAAWSDISRVQRLTRDGWLGFENDPVTPIAFAERAWDALGPVLLLAGVAIVVALARRRRADLILLSFAAIYTVYLMTVGAHFDRYVLPLVPVLAVLAGSIRLTVPVALALLVVPLVWSVGEARELTRTDTRIRADAWISTHVPAADLLAADPSTLPFPGRRVIRLELPGPGRQPDARRDIAALRKAGARWLVVSGAVTDRVLAATAEYPAESRFYESLIRDLRPALSVSPEEPGLAGPWVRVYRLAP